MSIEEVRGATAHTGKSPLTFFLLVFVISVPFWLIGAFTKTFLPKDIPLNLPVSALMVFNPMLAALILTFRESRIDGVRGLLTRIFDYRRIQKKIWFLPIFLLMPFIAVVEYGLLTLLGHSMPIPQYPLLTALLLFCALFITAIGEELGWQGYAFDRLQARWNALQTSLILGIVWAVWHGIPYLQADTPIWTLWQCAATVGLRVLIVWLYKNTGKSLFAAIIFHTTINVSNFLFPVYGSYYDPFIACIVIAVVVVAVIVIWGPKTLARSSV